MPPTLSCLWSIPMIYHALPSLQPCMAQNIDISLDHLTSFYDFIEYFLRGTLPLASHMPCQSFLLQRLRKYFHKMFKSFWEVGCFPRPPAPWIIKFSMCPGNPCLFESSLIHYNVPALLLMSVVPNPSIPACSPMLFILVALGLLSLWSHGLPSLLRGTAQNIDNILINLLSPINPIPFKGFLNSF